MSNKFRTGLVREYREEQEHTEEQQNLRNRHKITDENVVVVEKNHVMLVPIKIVGGILRIVCIIALCVLATIGLIAVAYPDIRQEVVKVVSEVLRQITV